jgi:hypothetical protein
LWKALAGKSPAFCNLLGTQMFALKLRNRREVGLHSWINLDAVSTAFTKTSAPTSDFKLDALSMGEHVEISLAEFCVVYGVRLQ